jgi:hypothetical protein
MPDGMSIRSRQLNHSANPREGFGMGAAPPGGEPLTAATIEIDDDGGVTIKAPVAAKANRPKPDSFSKNLAMEEDIALASLAEEILAGIEADQQSRKMWIENYNDGLDLLGLTIEDAKSTKSGPASKIGHPLLLGAVIKAQSAASAELLPSGGPCKIATRDGDDQGSDELAQALESDLNWYITTGSPEFYPNLDRGLFGLFLNGNLFRKVYEHPVKRRPVAETVEVSDLIVSEDADDLETAVRVTHRAEMSRSAVKRMQWKGVWRDIDLAYPMPIASSEQKKRQEVQGTTSISLRPQDMSYTILETTTDLDLSDYGYEDPHAPDDLPVSYIVTIDKDSRQVLDIRRGWKADDEEFQRKQRFVHYMMIPALGFLCLGHLHLLGNQTKALRAIWRILVTLGMYGSAPAGIKAKSLRMGTNEINPQPGEFVDIDVGPFDDISKAIMPFPYKDLSQVFVAFADSIGKESGNLSSAADMPVGESRVDIPVGTILAMIEQATQMASAIHKRLYRAQARELQLLKECFAENPEALWKLNRKPARKWQSAEEFADTDLVPASDPNVPSQIHRIMLATAMVTLAGQNPDIYDRVKVHDRAWKSIGVNDADTFLHEPDPNAGGGKPGPAPPDPLIGQARMLEAQAKIQSAQNAQTDSQRKAATEAIEAQHSGQALAQEGQTRAAELASERQIEAARLAVEQERLRIEQVRAGAQHDLATRQAAHGAAMDVAGHHLAVAQHGLDVGQAAAEHQRATDQQEQDATNAEREHGRAKEELGIKRKVANKPVPKPAAARPRAKK